MTSAAAIATHGPVKHWSLGDAADSDTLSPDLNNMAGEGFHSQPVDPEDERWGGNYAAPCAGDAVTDFDLFPPIAYDYRAPRGAYQYDAGAEYGVVATPEFMTRASLPFPLFSQPFTLVWMAGNFDQGIEMRFGEGGFAPPWSYSDWAPVLSYGSHTACVGFESGETGGWFTVGAQGGSGSTVRFGYGSMPEDPDIMGPTRPVYGTAAAGAGIGGLNYESGNTKGITAFVYDPTHPTKGFIWCDGQIEPLTILNSSCLNNAINSMASYADPFLMFATGPDPGGWGRRVPVYGEFGPLYVGPEPVTQMIYPWYSGAGLLHNVALFDRAMPYAELRDMFVEVNGQPPNGCSPWQGPGPEAVIDSMPLGDNRWTLSGARSFHPYPGTITRYDWFGGTNYLGETGDDPVEGGGGTGWLGNAESIDLELVDPDVYGNQVEVILRVQDDFGTFGYATVQLTYTDPEAPTEDRLWAVGRVRF